MKNDRGENVTTDEEILGVFHRYYQELYTSEVDPSLEEMERFFRDLQLPALSEEERASLEVPITLSEVTTAIESLSNGKAPGPDGLSVEFFKAFNRQLAPILLEVFLELTDNPMSDTSFHMANTIVLPKSGKDPALPHSYRPISLLNLENKIYAKILATRLSGLIARLVLRDQAGFVPGRLAADHGRLLCNILQHTGAFSAPMAVISIDAEKAFDRVEFLGFHPNQIWIWPVLP